MDEYIRRYSERDVDGVTELCLTPFLAIREGAPIHMPDTHAVRDHFAAMIDAYRGGGVAVWKRIESDVHELGDDAVFVTVRWNALVCEGRWSTPRHDERNRLPASPAAWFQEPHSRSEPVVNYPDQGLGRSPLLTGRFAPPRVV